MASFFTLATLSPLAWGEAEKAGASTRRFRGASRLRMALHQCLPCRQNESLV
jgi:hypothetical protein